ncbi:MAG: ATP-binding cassette domain-containing protein [Pseudomonadota bacterium]
MKIKIESLSFFYKKHKVIDCLSHEFPKHTITAITGPSGVGKSSLLSVFNRLYETVPHAGIQGKVLIRIDNRLTDIHDRTMDVTRLRRLAGMVFQIPNPLPMSIYRNIAFPLKLAGITDKNDVEQRVVKALKDTGLWKEVRDRLEKKAMDLSGGQQQRLCIARALVLEPEILLLDEPTSSLDKKSAAVIQELMTDLKKQCTLVMVSHHLEQVNAIADDCIVLTAP